MDVQVHENIQELYEKYKDRRFFYATTKAKHRHSDVQFEIGDMIVFGPETRGLPESLLVGNEETCIRIPMVGEARSLNLSNSVAIVAYEAMRQLDYPDLQVEGPWVKA